MLKIFHFINFIVKRTTSERFEVVNILTYVQDQPQCDGPSVSTATVPSSSSATATVSSTSSSESHDCRLTYLGFKRSTTQPKTPGDGSCALWAILDSISKMETEKLCLKPNGPKTKNCTNASIHDNVWQIMLAAGGNR